MRHFSSGLIRNCLAGLGLAVSGLTLAACSSEPCHHLKRPELAQTANPSAPTATAVASVGGPSNHGALVTSVPAANPPPLPNDGRAQVYKADGSLQCGMAAGLTPVAMEKQLEGIKVYARDKKPDGLMHIQVCGSATGQVNIFDIPASSVKEAEKRGFKRVQIQP